MAVLASSGQNATQNAHAFSELFPERTWKNMKIFEEAIQNVKKRRAKNVVEMTDYDHFRAEIFYKNSISRTQSENEFKPHYRIYQIIREKMRKNQIKIRKKKFECL